MRSTKAIFAIWVCACLFTSLVRSDPALGEGIDRDAVRIVSVTAKDLEPPDYDPSDTAVKMAAGGANAFAFRLSAALSQETGSENFVCSPYSVWMPLAALVNAVDEPCKSELLTALGVAGLGEEDLNRAASRMLYDLTNEESKMLAMDYGDEYHYNPLRIANAVFVSHAATPKQDFAQAFLDAYRGTTMRVDFGAREAVDAVNAVQQLGIMRGDGVNFAPQANLTRSMAARIFVTVNDML